MRTFWIDHHAEIGEACIEQNVRRDWQYGLNYYQHRALPTCDNSNDRSIRIGTVGGRLELIKP